MDMYVIAWQSKETRNEGQGTAHFDLETAQAICTEANQEYPFLVHWPKRVDTTLVPTFEAVKDCPCVICHDDAEWLVNGYSLCGRHAIRMTTGRTYEQLQDEFDYEFQAEATPVLYPIVGMESTCDEDTPPIIVDGVETLTLDDLAGEG